jgi:flavodoxin I
MNALVIYDSLYGNTEQIAKIIAKSLNTTALNVNEVRPTSLKDLDILVVGSPTQGGRPTPSVKDFLDSIPGNGLKRIGVTSFDTRISGQDNGFGIKILVGILGFAAGRISRELTKKGGKLVADPVGFIVTGKEGPLKEGEVDRAQTWAAGIVKSSSEIGV